MAGSSGFDQALFQRYRAAKGRERSRLEAELVAANEGLTKVLISQLTGRGENRAGRRAVFGKQFGSEHLDHDEALACGRLGILKAIRDYNPGKAGFAYYAAQKLRYEVQAAVLKSRVVNCPRDTTEEQGRPKGFEFLDGEEFDRTIQHEGETLAERWAREAEEDAAEAKRQRPTSAVADFIARRCEFRPVFRVLRARLVSAYEHHARTLGFPVTLDKLRAALDERSGHRIASIVTKLPGHSESARVLVGVRVLSLRELQSRQTVAESAA